MKKDYGLKIIGFFLIIIGILAIVQSIERANINQIFWVCYLAIIIVGIGILVKDSALILVELNILLVPLIFWNIDFFYQLFTSVSLWGITDYFFIETRILQKLVSLQHVFVIPLSLIALYFIKIKRKDLWKVSLFQLVLIFIATYLLTPIEKNINCVFKSCVSFLETGSYHILIWFALAVLMIVLTNYLITSLKIFTKESVPLSPLQKKSRSL